MDQNPYSASVAENAAPPETAFEIQSVSKSFGSLKALNDVSFSIPRGSIFGLLGPNGAGKTTLFSILASFISRDGGHVRVLDTDVDHPSRLQGRLSILPQDAAFQANVPIMDQLVFFRRLDGRSKTEAEAEVKAVLELVGLGEYLKRGVRALSHGMLKRMGIAQAFLGQPEVVILDEPTAGLDPQNAMHIRKLVQDMVKDRNATVLFSSHNLLEIQELCDHVAILDKGKLVACGRTEEMTRSGWMLRLRLSRELTSMELEALKAEPEVDRIDDHGKGRYQLGLDLHGADISHEDAIAKLLRRFLEAGAIPMEIQEGNSLEEFFLKVTGNDDDAQEAG